MLQAPDTRTGKDPVMTIKPIETHAPPTLSPITDLTPGAMFWLSFVDGERTRSILVKVTHLQTVGNNAADMKGIGDILPEGPNEHIDKALVNGNFVEVVTENGPRCKGDFNIYITPQNP